jgi:tripartite-type tricarboxylate transporter receptor subunit TctC
MIRILFFLSLLLGLAGANVEAQTWPSRPLRIVVPIPPGGAPDITARVLGDKLGEGLGQPVVVENRPGGNGNVAADIVVHAAADGYTLLLCADSGIVINPHVYATMSFDPLTDLLPVATVASNQFFLAANPGQPFHTFPEFIAYAKKVQPPLAYASGGNGSQHQLTMEMLKQRAGIDLVHVPYRGGAPAATAIIAGEVAVGFAGSSSGTQIKAGQLRALATAAKQRLADFPDLPTIAEFYPGFTNSIWLAVCAPRATPDAVVARLRAEIRKALEAADVKDRFARSGALEPFITTPEEFASLIRADYERYGKVIKDVGVKID